MDAQVAAAVAGLQQQLAEAAEQHVQEAGGLRAQAEEQADVARRLRERLAVVEESRAQELEELRFQMQAKAQLQVGLKPS